ncbi:stage VI sporulation protein F [Texcoconibacillus texcoconensis]|uniref:Sporulation protein n=1 Tax=Texcoconibacillus texcoconensis TaxID=1095777 RepID=A0A840QPM9_9BACI|nr:hypothetical protein [Texcoconibacillus texcoconensis]
MSNNPFFKNFEKKTGVNMDEVKKLAESVKDYDLKDEENVRDLIQQVGSLANKPVSKEVEDELIQKIMNDSGSIDFNTVSQMMNNKKKD